MRKIFLLCILFLGFTTTQAQEKVQPIIGFDSLNSLLMSRLKFSNELVKSGRTAEISFNVKVDSTGRIKDIIGKTRKTDTINTDLPEQIIPILHSLEWNRSITEGSINFKFNFSDSIPKPAKAFAVKKKVVFLRPEDMTKDSPPVRAEIEASFKGGMDALLYYVRDSFNYPELSMKKYLVATLIFFCSYQSRAQSTLKPIIGWDSLNNYLLKKLDFPDSLISNQHAVIFRFTVVQNRKNILKNISFISSIPSNSVLAEPIISILTNEIQWEKHLGANDITLIISRFNYNYVSTDTTARKDKVTWDYIPEEDTSGAREAAFPGGMRGFMNYVAQSFNYPKRCQKKKINGTVLLEFVIGINGAVKKIRVISETEKCPEFAQEAIRVLTESPRWIPGTVSGGILVNSYRTLPIQLSVN